MVEALGGAGDVAVTRMEAAGPAPSIFIMRSTSALADPANADVAKEHLPAFLVAVLLAAAGEGGHVLLNPQQAPVGKPRGIAGRDPDRPILLSQSAQSGGDLLERGGKRLGRGQAEYLAQGSVEVIQGLGARVHHRAGDNLDRNQVVRAGDP